MIIILEGPDGGGKTTLAKELAELAGFEYQHQGPYDGEDTVVAQTLRKIYNAPRPVVFDRLHVGERIYGPVLRKRDLLGSTGQRAVERVLGGMRTILVLVRTGTDDMLEQWRQRKSTELFQDEEQARTVCQHYNDPMHPVWVDGHLPLRHYDWRRHSAADLLTWAHAYATPSNRGPGIGWFIEGNILIVGERTSGPTDINGPDRVFVGTRRGSCSPWLNRLLCEAEIPEQQLYWVNAQARDGTDNFGVEFINHLRPRAIVTLGKVATQWAENHAPASANIYSCQHPQYHKRFRAKEHYSAIEILHRLTREETKKEKNNNGRIRSQ